MFFNSHPGCLLVFLNVATSQVDEHTLFCRFLAAQNVDFIVGMAFFVVVCVGDCGLY